MPTKSKHPLFLSATVMRRAFQARLLSVHPRAEKVLAVTIRRLGGFEDKSYRIRYSLRLRMRSGVTQTIKLRGSSEVQDQTRRQAYVIMKFLWRHGFDSGAFQIARPVTFFWRWRLLIYEEALGQPMLRYLRQHPSPQQANRVILAAAEWLYRLHGYSPRAMPQTYNRAGRQQYWLAALALLAPARNASATGLRREIRRVMAFEHRLASDRGRVLVHHDFHPGNILVTGKSIRVVDFTESRLSHPIVDVATFSRQIELLLEDWVTPVRIAAWQNLFLSHYQRLAHINLSAPASRRVFRFVRDRIELQRQVAARLFQGPGAGRRPSAGVK